MKPPALALALSVLLAAGSLYGQNADGRWEIFQRLQGSSNSFGQVLRLDTGVTFDVGRGFSLGGAVPYYLVRDPSGTAGDTFSSGIGNAYVGVGYASSDTRIRYSTYLQVGAPTGDVARGFGTGDVTVDWTHTLSVPVRRFTPFTVLGVANTVSDTSFFTRPFSSTGLVGHAQAGLLWWPAGRVSIGGSAYAVLPSGEQTVVSRGGTGPPDGGNPEPPGPGGPPGGGPPVPVPTPGGNAGNPVLEAVTVQEVTGDADLSRDHGFSSWFSVFPTGNTDFYIGYSRSVPYDLDSVFFGIGWSFRAW